jgi:3-deoxy-manno-octulosonate cytidylyltransferase (CMP-KDO synthetase)
VHPVRFPNPFDRAAPPSRVVAVIPSRYASTRLPGKPLLEIAGRSMIEHVYRRAASAPCVDAVVVATDDARIAMTVERFGGVARMTRSIHRSGMDRIAEVAPSLDCEIIINVQGDEPLVAPEMLAQLIEPLDADPSLQISTLRRRISGPEDYKNPNVVKVVVDRTGDALYFSRAPVPWMREGDPPFVGPRPWFQHIGLYAYRRSFLIGLTALPPTQLELAESLEQLRVLEHGYRIHVAETQHESIGVDTPEDLERVRRHLSAPARA